jgi:hypothetical protein
VPVVGSMLPIENSPPEIQTMPFGAGPGADVRFETVSEKGDEPAAMVIEIKPALIPSERRRERIASLVFMGWLRKNRH